MVPEGLQVRGARRGGARGCALEWDCSGGDGDGGGGCGRVRSLTRRVVMAGWCRDGDDDDVVRTIDVDG